jgi:hypothetical protein
MFKSRLATYPDANVRPSYLENVTRAALALVTAILAIAPVKSEAAAPKPAMSDHARAKRADELIRLAQEFEATMPSQAAELRFLASVA